MSLHPPASIETSNELKIAPLQEDEALAAFTLAQLRNPELELDRWDNFLCDWRADPDGRGILAAYNLRGSILGLACWWRQPDLHHGQTLWAGPFFVHEMGVRPLVRESLIAALEDIALSSHAKLKLADSDAQYGQA